jgi:hypothetical protein
LQIGTVELRDEEAITPATGVVITDLNDNPANLLVTLPSLTAQAIVVDGVPPTIVSVSATETSQTLKLSDSITLLVKFSEDVAVTNTPQLHLDNGGAGVYLDYAGMSGADTLTFVYNVVGTCGAISLSHSNTFFLMGVFFDLLAVRHIFLRVLRQHLY